MNDRLNVQVLRSQLQDAISRIELLPDEPTYSYVTRVALLTGTTKRKKLISELFGRASIRPEQLVHAGFGHFAASYMPNDGKRRDDLPLAHSMLGLLSPFLSSGRLQQVIRKANGNCVSAIYELNSIQKSKVFRGSPAVCLDCVDSDLRKLPFAYHRRLHQVTSVTVCPDHGTPLIVCCDSCRKTFSYEDLPSLHCQSCGEPLRAEAPGQPSISNPEVAVKFAKAIQACLNGMIPYVDAATRVSALRHRVGLVVGNRSGVVGDNLAMSLCNAYGRPYLESVNLRTDRMPTFGWPALLISGMSLIAHPIANCLLIALLFESIDDYRKALDAAVDSSCDTTIPTMGPIAASRISLKVLKDILRLYGIREVASRNNIPYHILKKWVIAYPGLSERQKKSKDLLLKLRNIRLSEEYYANLREEPWNDDNTADQFERGKLPCNDRNWDDEAFQVQIDPDCFYVYACPPNPPEDSVMADELQDYVQYKKALLRRPCQLTRESLILMSGLLNVPNNRRIDFHETMAQVTRLTESDVEFYRRSLEWGAKDLVRRYGRCDHIIELFVHARVSVKYVRALEPFAKNLLAGLAGTSKN